MKQGNNRLQSFLPSGCHGPSTACPMCRMPAPRSLGVYLHVLGLPGVVSCQVSPQHRGPDQGKGAFLPEAVKPDPSGSTPLAKGGAVPACVYTHVCHRRAVGQDRPARVAPTGIVFASCCCVASSAALCISVALGARWRPENIKGVEITGAFWQQKRGCVARRGARWPPPGRPGGLIGVPLGIVSPSHWQPGKRLYPSPLELPCGGGGGPPNP